MGETTFLHGLNAVLVTSQVAAGCESSGEIIRGLLARFANSLRVSRTKSRPLIILCLMSNRLTISPTNFYIVYPRFSHVEKKKKVCSPDRLRKFSVLPTSSHSFVSLLVNLNITSS